MKLAIGCDEAGFNLKQMVIRLLKDAGHIVEDMGAYDEKPVLYPAVGEKVAKYVAQGHADRGILICGTGIGMCITANKVSGIRAAVCHDLYSAKRARMSNNAQILCMGARVIGPELAKSLVEVWLASEFAGGGSTAKVELITAIEHNYKTI